MAWPARAVGADFGDDRQREVLGAEAFGKFAEGGDAHPFGLFLPECLRHQHMGHFRGADAERKRAEGAMGRGVAVAANDQQARQRQAQFRADHMHDALAAVVEPEQGDVLIGGILVQLADHARDFGIGNRLAAAARRHIMIGDAERQFRLRHRGATLRQPAESVERAFMHIVAIGPKQRLAVALHDLVPGPELVEQCEWRGHAAISGSRALRCERYIVC